VRGDRGGAKVTWRRRGAASAPLEDADTARQRGLPGAARTDHGQDLTVGPGSYCVGCCKLIFAPPEEFESCTVSTASLEVPGGTSNDTTT
jgi:hypothetical protein